VVWKAALRRVGIAAGDEPLKALTALYREASRAEKGRITSELALVAGHHRKHAALVLRATSRLDRARRRTPERGAFAGDPAIWRSVPIRTCADSNGLALGFISRVKAPSRKIGVHHKA
jgi:hypothetical protein